MNTNPKLILFTVMLVSFIGTIGIALPYPVLAPYFINYPANNLTHFLGLHPKILLGIALATYPLGMLIGSIYIGALSDCYGRKKVLLISLFVAIIGYLLTALAIYNESFVFFILARFLTGLSEGNIAIARAIAADLHPKIKRTQSLSMIYAATYTGWMIGPIIGGFLMVYGVEQVFLIAGIGLALSTVLVFMLIRPDNINTKDTPDFWHTVKNNNSLTLLKNPAILPIFWFYFLYSMGLNAFYDFYPVWFVDYFHVDGRIIAMATMSLTVVMIITSSFVVTRIQEKIGEYYAMLIGGSFLFVLLFIQPFLNLNQSYVIFALIGAAIAITNGMIPSFLSNYFGHLGQGKVMGLQTSIFCFTNVIIAIIGGPLAIFDSIWVLLLGGLLVLVSIVVLWINRESQLQLIALYKNT